MDRSRSKRSYYYDQQDYDASENFPRTKPRYANPANHHFSGNRHRLSGGMGSGGGGGGGGGRSGGKVADSSMVTTSYRILCHDLKAGGVIGKSGSIIKAIRQHTGAWINVHELVPGDEERIIEISDTRRRDPDGRMPSFSPAQEALFLIHERILESEATGYGGGYDEGEYGGIRGGVGAGAGGYRVVTRLVVSQQHVGSLLGKGGKIIEQMRIETKTQIRILPRDHTLPRCVSEGEEIVQVIGDADAVKNAIAVISSRLRESQHRDRGHLQNRFQTEDRFFEEDLMPQMNNGPRRSSVEGPPYGSRAMSFSASNRNNSYGLRASSHDLEIPHMPEHPQIPFEDLVFRILCPNDKVDSVVGESDGIVDLLQNEIGVDVKISDHVAGSDERVIIISSDEGPDDELFPAQEALLHIQTRIVDLVPESDNIVTTRLLVPSTEVRCLVEVNGLLSEIKNSTGADVEVLPRDKVPAVISETDELVQIVGEIKAAREALVEVTRRLRSYLYQDTFRKDMPPTSDKLEAPSPKNITAGRDAVGTETRMMPENMQTGAARQHSKGAGVPENETPKQAVTSRREEIPTTLNRVPKPLVTKSTLEVVIPDYAVPKLLAKSKNKLAQISELSGANVTLVEDDPEVTEKVIRISGTPEQVERAQSLLQGFLLSIQEDA